MQINEPKPGPIEVGLGRGVQNLLNPGGWTSLLLWGLGGSGGGDETTTNYYQTVSGDGSSGVIGPGRADAYTSPPTVVHQPEPLVVTQPEPVIMQ